MLAPLSVSVPAPSLFIAPLPSITPLRVRLVTPVVTSKAPVPPVAIVNVLVLEVVLPVYCRVPATPPVLPNETELALLPSTPLALTLLMVPMARVPAWMLNRPVNVFAPERVSLPDPVMFKPPVPLIIPEIAAESLAELALSTN